jgi:effector-binding domain-containing protein
MEIGVEVDRTFPDGERVVCSATPAGLAATTAHFGPYDRLGAAHEAIQRWCAANHLALAGPSWAIYGHWTDDSAKLRTDVFYLLQPEKADENLPVPG